MIDVHTIDAIQKKLPEGTPLTFVLKDGSQIEGYKTNHLDRVKLIKGYEIIVESIVEDDFGDCVSCHIERAAIPLESISYVKWRVD